MFNATSSASAFGRVINRHSEACATSGCVSLAAATCNQPTHTRLSNGIVGLHGALLKGNQARLFAECAIVAHSDPACEYDETCIKLAGMRAALQR